MIDLAKITKLKRQRLSGLIGLSLDGSKLEGVVLKRPNGSLQIQQTFVVSLSLDPLTAEPELVGQEIRNHLDAAGVTERRCVVGLPLKWALTTHIELPDLAEEDVPGFIELEAERVFPCDAQTLQTAVSRCQGPAGKQHATLISFPKNHLTRLEQALRAAKLKPLGFSIGIAALQPATAELSSGVIALLVGENHVGLQVTCGGGVAALRALEGALEIEGSRRELRSEIVAREARITLGQLPAELRESVRRVRIFGPRDLAQRLADEMELRFGPMGLAVEIVGRYAPDEFGLQLPADASVSAAFSLAARHLAGRVPLLDFLPPKVTPWQQFSTRYSSGKLRMAGAAAAVALLLIGGLFGFQQWQLSKLDHQWSSMSPKVHEIEAVQQQIRQFRPWYDDSLHGLTILRQLTTAFPEDGVVSAKTVEIRDLSAVTCIGVARDNQSLLKTLDRLRAAGGVSDLKVNQIRGKSPMQFTFDFHWAEGIKHEN